MTPVFDKSTSIQEIYAAYPDTLSGRSFIVTGATAGLGLAFSKFIAGHGAGTVIISGRSEEKLKRALTEVQAAASSAGKKLVIKSVIMDMTDYGSIKRAAAEINTLEIKIDNIINNAGIMAVPYSKINGYENQFVANHLGHFLFTNLIIESLSKHARVISTTSVGHFFSPVRFHDINFQDGAMYDKWQGYGQSKSANILFAKGLTRRYNSRDIESFSVHPGFIEDTNLADHLDMVEEGIQNADGTWKYGTTVSMQQGIATYLYASIAPELQGKGGEYLTESQIHETSIPLTDEDAERFWDLSNEILGTAF